MTPATGSGPALVAAASLVLLLALATAALAALWLRERRRAATLAADLEAARDRAAAASEARDTFFDLATHELRSPISAILGYQELLRDGAFGALEPVASEPVDRIGRSARHLLHLIDGLIELSRIRAGDLRPDLGPVNLGILLASVADAFRTHARERGLDPTIRLPRGLPTVHSDQDRLVAALDLLVTSAIKHHAGPGITLVVDPRPDGADLTIDGTEIGIRHDAGDPALRLGIRLAVAAAVADLLGGELRLEPPGSPVVQRLVFTIRSAAGRPEPGL